MDTLQTEIGTWGKKTFGHQRSTKLADLYGILNHLKDEVNELVENPYDTKEVADCGILILQYAEILGISLNDAINEKFAEIKTRKWGPPDERGVIRHIKED